MEDYRRLMPKMLIEAERIGQEEKPLIEKLQERGFSEKGNDIYYNIFLKSLYQFDGTDIVLRDGAHEMFSTENRTLTGQKTTQVLGKETLTEQKETEYLDETQHYIEEQARQSENQKGDAPSL